MEPLRFNISLTVLNHLGRNLYRSFATILGEAISNAWDAEAESVHIKYDPEEKYMCITDDGFGMSRDDLQNKFLNIGYSKRDKFGIRSPNKSRPHIGRKGIGKLALLSCAEEVVILSKISGGSWGGVLIDNREINQEIEKGKGTADYILKEPDLGKFKDLCTGEMGTVLCFVGLKEERNYSNEFLKKIIALYFRFSLIDSDFKIFLNSEEVRIDALQDLVENTQFVWTINGYNADPYLKMLKPSYEPIGLSVEGSEIEGFIASVRKPTNRNIFGAKERIGIDLFVNGRMREVDILKHFPSSRIPEEYLYGQIHINSLDNDNSIDRFTSSREGVQVDDPTYKVYLEEMKSLVSTVIDQWDELRDKYGEDGDPDNTKRENSKTKKAKSLYREVAKDYIGSSEEGKNNDEFIKDLANDAAFNNSSYVECFISENLLRKHIEDNNLLPTSCLNCTRSGETCIDRYDPKNGNTSFCEYCKGERGKQNLQKQKNDASSSIKMRSDENNILMYLDYFDLAKIIDDKILKDEDKYYKPLRNSVMHTSLLTKEAKTKLSSVFDNIVSTVKKIMNIN